jgi:hypothetical protein
MNKARLFSYVKNVINCRKRITDLRTNATTSRKNLSFTAKRTTVGVTHQSRLKI